MSANQGRQPIANTLRPCREEDRPNILRIVNAAAEAYRDTIPADRWHEPYMSAEALEAEIADGVVFTGVESEDGLLGVMGVQAKRNVDLIRHAYVLPKAQGRGIGSALIAHIRAANARPMLVGTWRAARWAVAFYERHEFAIVPEDDVAPLLRTYWMVPERQIETSTVLSSPPLGPLAAAALIAAASAERRPADGQSVS